MKMVMSGSLRDSHIVVIGAGAVGAAVSYRLSQAGAHVTTIERRYVGSGITSVSFAWINGFEKVPKHYHRLNVMSIRDHQDLADELNGRWVRVDGGLHWEHAAEADRVKQLRNTVRQLREWGNRVEQITPDVAMREIAADLWIDPEQVSEVYFMEREGVLDPVLFAHSVMHQAMIRYGAKFEHANVTAIRGPKGTVDQVILDDGRAISADVIINCAGPEADRVAGLAGAHIPLAPTLGLTLSTPPAPVCLRQVVHSPEANLRPDGAGRLILRTREVDTHLVPGVTPPIDSPVVQNVIERARKIVPGLCEIPVERVRVGTRSIPADAVSIVGFDPSVSGFYTVVTHSGITLSARLALLVTEDLSTADCAELAPYRPSRFTKTAAN
jgi:glycine/D-amino acid oxidase-like deaminating enzyme